VWLDGGTGLAPHVKRFLDCPCSPRIEGGTKKVGQLSKITLRAMRTATTAAMKSVKKIQVSDDPALIQRDNRRTECH
jgi:hypothetical protein